MAQDLNAIISELDAAYNPSRQTINDRINGLQGAQDSDIAGLQAQQTQAFDDITNGARSKGMGFSGIPIQEQAKYTASSFLPAVAKVKQSYSDGRNSLVDALNNMNIDQRKTAMSIRETQQNRDFEAQQAQLQRDAAARAASASSGALGSILGGGAPTPQGGQPAQADPYAKVDKNNANVTVKRMLSTNDPARIAKEINAISASAAYGNMMDRYKLDLLQSLQQNSQYGSLLAKVAKSNASKVIGARF
jgi:hypothetical protein